MMKLRARHALGLGSAILALAACGGDDSTADTQSPPTTDAAAAGDARSDGDASSGADALADGSLGDAGTDGPSDAPKAPDADTTPIPTPIRYVLVLVKENHTFDNYFTGFPGAASTKTAKLSTGKTLTRSPAPSGPLAKDICHANSCGQKAYNGGAMNGFDLLGAGDAPFDYYTEAQIPNYWQYARNFVLADHFFSTTLGPSTPGHTVFWNAQSLVLDNAKCTVTNGACSGSGCGAGADVKITSYDPDDCTTKTVAPCFDVPTLADHLPKSFTWADYGGALALMTTSVYADPNHAQHFHKQGDLVADLTAGKLANLTIAHLWSGDESEHPVAYPCVGENFTVQIVNAAMQLPQWKQMAIVITWDDWGGFYDHVAPPVHECANGQVFQSGFRLPAIIVSPYAKKGYVLSTPTEQASVPRLVEELWGMDFMTARDKHALDGTAGSLMGAFDFGQTPRTPLLLKTRTCP